MKNALISGGTGFLGSKLTTQLQNQDYHVYILTRSVENKVNTSTKTYIDYTVQADSLPIFECIINLAGESLFGYWTEQKKQSILDSRLKITNYLIQLMKEMNTKPKVFISASAVGYYGMSEDFIFTEKTTEAAEDYLASVTEKWEETAKAAKSFGIRTVFTRLGILLGNQGAFPMMKLPTQLFAGGRIGNGEQWLSWIHIDDAVQLILFCMHNSTVTGPINVTAPDPKRNKDFMKTIAKTYKKPYWFHVPRLVIEATLGEMAQLITKGQYAYPQKAIDHGFFFKYPKLDGAIENIKNSTS
ncbi:cell-division inhibitor [Oceanobacillus iheyensis HTE831]|uniref:Cell-division inhibitor n=1 Tax=Oceanobacillus iheyensis (strain DSM 14371 / CIP 107618 / JCM 11309 / KCTC 3954 / HTE831) TaxID=221109 RepID=Q8CV65_OCEIH|nr:TIGR01777 family oxidoreductase [Oceanobacillus iheyensis]BAC12848.1 cell-division inhibitor [Oceanobacillus iheyensis HTE831]